MTSPPSGAYNCIAWVVEDLRWWSPPPMGGTYWPPGIPWDDSLETWVLLFEHLGFVICETDELEPHFQKIAIYGQDGRGSHVALLRLDDGRWSSKLGFMHDIAHSLESLEDAYGPVQHFLKRSRENAVRAGFGK